MSEAFNHFVDPGIPTLSVVLNPLELGKHLDIFSSPPWLWGALQEVQIRVLTYHKGSRCTLEIALRTVTGWKYLIGKVYVTDRSDVYSAMEGIRRAGFGQGEEFSIPQPIAFLSPLSLLLQERVQGRRAEDFFLAQNERDWALAAERCARWLARFHARGPRVERVFDANNHLISMERWSWRLAQLGEPFTGKVARLFQGLECRASGLGGMEMCAGHGSYSPGQVILAGDRTVVFDWDGYDLADPSRDVARFIISLHRLGLGRLGSIRALDFAAEVFLKTYMATGRLDVGSRLPFYKAATCLQLAKYNLAHRVPHWREKIEAMLEEGLRILEG